MATKKKKGNNDEEIRKEIDAKVTYPIGLLFQVSTLAGTLSFLMFSISGAYDVATAVFRSFVVFSVFAIAGGILMVVAVSILHDITMRNLKEEQQRLEEEHLLQIERQEEELRLLQAQLAAASIPNDEKIEQLRQVASAITGTPLQPEQSETQNEQSQQTA
ncbi:MAG: hypothetical protein JNL32_11585 [Candidatus Kapabacteria bacterium]|nr:hypothetical protein [Candidatus Kapabacteria bacterium]